MAGTVSAFVQPTSSLARFQVNGECSFECRLKSLGRGKVHSRKDVLSSRRAFYSDSRLYSAPQQWTEKACPVSVHALLGDPGQPEDDEASSSDETSSSDSNPSDVNSELFRKQMEQMMDNEDASFGGRDLAKLIRNKYGRSYDVQLIKKEFMGRQLLAMNIMWKYREQRSFPLTEEEYLSHLDSVANLLRGWGAVSYIRTSLAKTKERPRIGKAVSIFIDLDESGGRAREWIYR